MHIYYFFINLKSIKFILTYTVVDWSANKNSLLIVCVICVCEIFLKYFKWILFTLFIKLSYFKLLLRKFIFKMDIIYDIHKIFKF